MNKEKIIKRMEEKSTVIAAAIVGLIIIFTAIILMVASHKPQYNTVTAKRADISQSVALTGTVTSAQDLSLAFKSGGSVSSIKASAGDKVAKGDILISLDNKSAAAAVNQAKAAVDSAQATYEKLLNGSTQNQIDVAKAAVDSAQVSLGNAQQTADKNLSSGYASAQTSLDDASIKMYNAYAAVDVIQKNHFSGNDQEGLSVRYNEDYGIKAPKEAADQTINAEKNSGKNEDIDAAISQSITSLGKILDALTSIRSTCDSTNYQSQVSSSEKASLDAQKSYISASLSALSQLRNSIAITKTQNQNSINSATAALSQAKASLDLAQAPARQEDIDGANANIEATEAALQIAQNAYADTMIRSPIDGVVAFIDPKIGEVVAAGSPAVSLISQGKYQVEAYVSETDLGKIKVGSSVKVTLDAYGSNQNFEATVISIDPSATMSNGIPTYKTVCQFNEENEAIKTGMTANLTIIGAENENALIVPSTSVIERTGQKFVMIYENGKIEERQITTGIKSSDGYTEILSGLSEGEKIISFGN